MADHYALTLFYKFFLSIFLGALIGIEREKTKQSHEGVDFAGIRTFMLMSFFGTIAAYVSSLFYSWLLAVIIVCFIVVVLSGYILTAYINKNTGITTELSAVIAFVIGILVYTAPQEIPIFMAVIITLILSFKNTLHKFVYNLKSAEFIDTIKFLLVAFVILPLLKPIESFGPYNSINLYEIWLMVVFISALSYVGYILIKTFGENSGTVLTGILGGILSSTAVVSTLASESKTQKESTPLVAAAGIASATMFIRVLIEVLILNFTLIEELTFPMLMLAAAGYLSVSIIWKRKDHKGTVINFTSPLQLKPALKFGLFYGFILFFSHVAMIHFGSKGILISGFISGIADVDAITIFVARNPQIGTSLGVLTITLAAVVNTAIKIIIAILFGTRNFSNLLIRALLPVILTGIVLFIII